MAYSIDIKELKNLLAIGESMILLDVRRKTDYEATPQKIPSAVWRDPKKIDGWLKHLPLGNRTVVYCAKGGSVSQSVSDRLQQEGFDAVFLEGDLKKWIDNGQPVEEIHPQGNATRFRKPDKRSIYS